MRRIVLASVELEDRADYALEPLKLLAVRGVGILSCITKAHPDRRLVHATVFLAHGVRCQSRRASERTGEDTSRKEDRAHRHPSDAKRG